MNTFSITHKLSLKEYINGSYRMLYSKPWMIFISGFSVLYIISTGVLLFAKRYDILNNDYYSLGGSIAFAAIFVPILMLLVIWRNYKTTYRVQEPITYEFSTEGYATTGESFSGKANWAKVYKIQIVQGWMFYIKIDK